jgi:hypothetical protein
LKKGRFVNPERWRQIEELYHAAQADPAVVEKADPELRREVESLLAHQGPPLDRPALECCSILGWRNRSRMKP